MGTGLNIITSNEASKWVQDSAFQVLSEGTLKAVGRPVFTMADTSASLDARKYSATKEFIFQAVSIVMYFAIITTVFQKMGFKALKKMPKFRDYEVLQNIENIRDFTKIYDAYSKGKIRMIDVEKQTKAIKEQLKTAKEAEEIKKLEEQLQKLKDPELPKKMEEQLQKAKGGMEVIKMIGSGLILTVMCPLLVAKMVSPIMKVLKPLLNPEDKNAQNKDDKNLNVKA